MKKILILFFLLITSITYGQIIRPYAYIIRNADTIYLRPNYLRPGTYVYNELKSTKPLWIRLDTMLKVSGGSLWIDGSVGETPTSGLGARTMIIPEKFHAFRSGYVGGTFWDNSNIGNASAAFGVNNKAFGVGTFVAGNNNGAIANYSSIFGENDSVEITGIGSFLAGACGGIIQCPTSVLLGGLSHTIVYNINCSSNAIIGGINSTNAGHKSIILGGEGISIAVSDSNRVFMRSGIFRLWDADKRDLSQWQLNSGTILSKIDTSGRFDINKGVYIRHDSTSASSSKTLLSFIGTTSGTAAAGFGIGQMVYLEKNNGTVNNASRIRTSLSHANGSSNISFWTYSGNAASFNEIMRIDTACVGIGYSGSYPGSVASYKLQTNGGIYTTGSILATSTIFGNLYVKTPKICPNTDVDLLIGLNAATAGKYINFATTVAGTAVNIVRFNNYGGITYVPGTLAVVAGTGIPSTSFSAVLEIAGSGGAVDITANPQVAAGNAGQVMTYICTSDANTVKFDDGTGLQLAGGASFTMGSGDVLKLIYTSTLSVWVEISRSDN